MGKRKHSDDDSSSSEDAEEELKSEKAKHKKHKKAKKEKKEKDKKGKEKKYKLERKDKKDKQHKKEGRREVEPPVSKDTQVNAISEDDYFARNTEFTTWLKEQRALFFNDLTAEETRQLFAEFVEAWNGRRLSAKYYTGLGGVAMRRSNHNWGFRGEAALPSADALGMAAARGEEQEASAEAASQRRMEGQVERRRWNAEQRQQLDELLPKATGREAQIEKKIARREAAREREASPEMNRLMGGGDVMGGDDSFQAARAREAQRQQRRTMQQAAKADSLAHRATEAAAKEDDRMAAFRALAAAGPITIAKRQ